MALSGVHVACENVQGLAGGTGLARKPLWSQTMATAGTTTQAAPISTSSGLSPNYGAPSFEVRASLDIYVAIGPTPDAANGARLFVPAGETRNIACDEGDKLAWTAA